MPGIEIELFNYDILVNWWLKSTPMSQISSYSQYTGFPTGVWLLLR
jgi:hypothetical protein